MLELRVGREVEEVLGVFVVDSCRDEEDWGWYEKRDLSASGRPGSGLEPRNDSVMESSSRGVAFGCGILLAGLSDGLGDGGEASILDSDSGNWSVISRSWSALGT